MDISGLRAAYEGRTPTLMGERGGSAVLVPLVRQNGEYCLLYEIRSAAVRQPGEVCFPGGKREPGETAIQCALRETREELGIPESAVTVIGEMDFLYIRAGSLLRPVLGEVDPAAVAAMRPAPEEVADTFLLPLRELRPIALSYLKNKRIPHVLGTEQEAVRLAERYGADVTKARVAALLHDCTKKLDMAEQLALCERYRIPLDELERKALKLLHSKTGAAIARDVFAVDDEVYNAILYHTTGKPDMTLLEKIIYLADYIEPTRDFPGVEELRRTVYEDLDRGLLLGLTMTIQEMEELGNPVHHMTRDARDYLMKRGIS